MPGWTVTSGSVDLVTSSYWQPALGSQSVDLAGSTSGSLTQSVSTVSGESYALGWYIAGNPDCGQSVKSMKVDWNGRPVEGAPYTFNDTGHSDAAMGWQHEEVTVTAESTTSVLSFADVTPDHSPCGSTLDGVTLTGEPGNHPVEITVEESAGHPLVGAEVLYIAPDGERNSAQSGSDGVASLHRLPEGTDTLYVYKQGFQPAVDHVTVSRGSGRSTVVLESGAVATSTLEDHEMSLAEIEAAGINTSDPANQNVYKFEVKLAFIELPQPAKLHCQVNAASEFVGECSFSGGSAGGEGLCSSSSCQLSVGAGTVVTAEPEVVEGHPLIQWLVLDGSVTTLKQFSTLKLTVQNLSPEGFELTDGSATIALPEGLSLAPTAEPQMHTQPVANIPGFGSATTTWIVRGDAPGKYGLSAVYQGQLEPFGAPVEVTAKLAQSLQIWGVEALSLSVKADAGKLYPGVPYHVVVGVTNKAPIPLYNVDLAVDPEDHANFDFQPGQSFQDHIGELQPGETLYSPTYVLLPAAESESIFKPSLSSATFAGEEAHPGENVEVMMPPSLYAAEIVAGTTGKIHLSWEPVPGAEGYKVFSTLSLTTTFAAEPEPVATSADETPSTVELPAGATNAYLAGNDEVRWYAVTSIVNGQADLESPAFQAASGPAPTITGLSLKKGSAAGGTTVTITGTNLLDTTAVHFGSFAATLMSVSTATSVTVTTPAATSGAVNVTVTTVNGTSAASPKARFTYAAPTITAISPDTGPTTAGTKVVISGNGFAIGTNTTTFAFGKADATAVTCPTTQECTASTPAEKTGEVDVTATVGKYKSKKTAAGQYTYG